MIHHSCDRCKRVIDPVEDVRYVVRMEVQAVMDTTEMDDAADDRDHLLEIHEILERLDDDDSDLIGGEVYQRQRFDLCPECHRRFMKNPLGRAASKQLGFSQN